MIRFFKRTPRLIQMEASECGATALGIILGYYGRFVSLEDLREKCGVSRDGATVYNMTQAADYYGLHNEVYEMDIEELQEASFPIIAYWQFNHFVVIEKIEKERIYINDPNSGPRTITPEELAENYSGVIIQLAPKKSFKKAGRPENFVERVKTKIWPFRNAFHYLFSTQLALVLLGLTIPVFTQLFIDKFFSPMMPHWQRPFLLMIVGVIILSGIMTWIQAIFLNFLQVRIAIYLSTEFLAHLLKLPYLFFTQRFGNELIHRMGLNTGIGDTLTSEVILNSHNLVLLSGYWIIMLYYNVPITIIAAFVALFNILLVWFIGRRRMNDYARLQQYEAKAIGTSFNALEHIETMKSSGNGAFFFSRLADCYTDSINCSQEIGKKDIWLSSLSSFSQTFSTVILLGIGCWQVMKGALTVGELIALQILLNFFLTPFTQLVSFSTELQSVDVDLARIDDVLKARTDPTVEERKISSPVIKLKGKLEFADITFGYHILDTPFIRHFNLSIEPGERIALTGISGSGKTTVAKLAAGLFQPWHGKVLYDGKSYSHYSRESLSQSIAHVDQSILLFSGTIEDNLTLWQPSISDETIIKAAKLACIHDDIAALPERYQTLLEEGGRNLSQGQRQRLEIARSLILNPAILILDEVTNSLDALTEKEVLSNIAAQNITTLIISHRLSTLRNCHRIIVLEQGKIIQLGTHEELSQIPGHYKKMLDYEITKKT
ncbi:MAG: Lactococcin-G-processing and transport ATP-binding protein LagD [Chlamydiae bacterium]|nr:Lactococcin-G-processing and transport ATP-binding protein LagD [Chlamydiota bacterium]